MIPETRKEAFKVLGLPESASTDDIKTAYRTLIRKWHSDKRDQNESEEARNIATEKFQEIIAAYRILTGETKEEEFIRQYPNDDWYKKWHGSYSSKNDWADGWPKEWFCSYSSKEEEDLFNALSRQDLTRTKALLKQVQNINAQIKINGFTYESILHRIVRNSCDNSKPGWRELLEEVLSKYSADSSTSIIDVNIMDKINRVTPLCLACKLGNLDVVNLLLKYGADPNVHGAFHPPLHYALRKNKIDIAKVLLEHGAKAEKLKPTTIIKYNKSAVEVLLPHLSDKTKGLMLYHIVKDKSVETDHDIEIEKLLLDAGVDPISGGRWIIIVPALLFGAVGATLAAMSIIPEIAAIGVIATAVLSGIAGAVIGCVTGYLVDVAINQCCGNQQCAA
ncbi:MAG: DnaJ domain-containing protein [Rickettsiales bacterium]|jgi:hypothetical protein|nr:DnaJ domain-containing protein [Rickettsiales bacterium]MDR1261510.1 DnaJ domain-containing protein [Rickettsiales bacterium]